MDTDQSKYLSMLEEKASLFRVLQSHQLTLETLDQEFQSLTTRIAQLEQQSKELQQSGNVSESDENLASDDDSVVVVEQKAVRDPSPVRAEQKRPPLATISRPIGVAVPKKSNPKRSNAPKYATPLATPPHSHVSDLEPSSTVFEEREIDIHSLVPWTTVLKETHGTGTLSNMTKAQKDRVDEAVFEFLALHMHPRNVSQCKVTFGKKVVAALPPLMIDAFENWLDGRIDAGMLDKANLGKHKKTKSVVEPAPKPAKREQLTAWIDIVGPLLPTLGRSDMDLFLPFVRAYLKEVKKPEKTTTASDGSKCLGIPANVMQDFTDRFTESFLNLLPASTESTEMQEEIMENHPSVFASLPDPATDLISFQDYNPDVLDSFSGGSEVTFHDVPLRSTTVMEMDDIYKDTSLRDGMTYMVRFNQILKILMPSYNATPKLVRKEIKASVKEYLISKLGSESKLGQCSMVATAGGQTFLTYGIPRDMYYDFRAWAIKELRRRFGDKMVPSQSWESN